MSDIDLSDESYRSKNTIRSRSGCWTCRGRSVKKKCDQQRPKCGRCLRLNIKCDYSIRPTLAERRRAAFCESPQQDTDSSAALSSVLRSASPSPTNSWVSLLDTPGRCSLVLTVEDHEAIRYFQTGFAKLHHTKHPDYSLISLMFNLAQTEPMIMHMVVAVGLQEINFRRPEPETAQARSCLRHYSLALEKLACAITPTTGAPDLDSIYTTLWLMLLYEQQFGDGDCNAYAKHLTGVAALLQHQSSRLKTIGPCLPMANEAPVMIRNSACEAPSQMSIYSARVLIWISLLDAAAASSGIGGQVNSAILTGLSVNGGVSPSRTAEDIKSFARFHRYSNPLYGMAWGEMYPQAELLDDFQNQNVYNLLAACVQLRHMTAQLAYYTFGAADATCDEAANTETSIRYVGDHYSGLLEAASGLSQTTGNNHRLIANLRAIVPIYYAVILDYKRLFISERVLDEKQRHALDQIMRLAYQSHKHGGDEATMKLAWPLFIAALETNDMIHQDWILERFVTLRKYGKNFKHAHEFLLHVLPLQQSTGQRVKLRDRLRNSALFILG